MVRPKLLPSGRSRLKPLRAYKRRNLARVELEMLMATVDGRNRGNQFFRVGMLRLRQHRGRVADLDDLTGIDDGDPVGDPLDDSHVVRDEQIGQPELALQVEEAFQKYAKFTDLRVTIVYGGVGYGKQLEDLRRGVDILAATPGRLLDHIEQGNCSLDKIDILVLDEVDRMLDMGFLPDVRKIVQKCPRTRQTLFFTATLPPEIEQLASWALREPVKVEIGRQRSPAETVSHAFYPVVATQKFDLLQLLLERTEFKSVIIFCRTRMGADRIAHRLKATGHTVGVMHSDRSQRERIEALDGFKSGKFEVLVATDIAARGLDIAGVSHVVNYDVPENAEDYVHRIGRTGRAQNTGDAFTLVTEEDVRDARSIERYMGVSVERKKLEGFPYIYSALFDEKALAETAAAAVKPTSRLHRGMRR